MLCGLFGTVLWDVADVVACFLNGNLVFIKERREIFYLMMRATHFMVTWRYTYGK